MATSTFERKIEIRDIESVRKLAAVMAEEASREPLSECPFSATERDRSEELLKQFFIPLKSLMEEMKEGNELTQLLSFVISNYTCCGTL